jgi:hypothetical protein
MKLILLAVLLVAATGPSNASDVAVSVSIGQPGYYGQLDIGGYPPPQVIYRQPRVGYDSPPMYLRVPPGHARNWNKHCGAYGACNQRVYFVKDSWYNKQYAPRYQERNSGDRDGQGDDRNNRHNEGRNHDKNR